MLSRPQPPLPAYVEADARPLNRSPYLAHIADAIAAIETYVAGGAGIHARG